uniref:Flagellar hook-associated protein 3 n=1 Tax=Solibacter usitatus (strain Ellin6076) TaxID=234267 RepID=Q01QL7_SOLUE
MISNLNQSSEAFLANIARVQRSVDEASRQVSSGKRVNVASDDPGNIDTIMQLKTGDTHNQQIQSNLAVVATDANAADTALTSATKLMDRARTLATQGSNFTMDAGGRQSMAAEVQSLLEQMVSISRTTVQGRYVFGGDQDATAPYDLDLTADNGVARLTNATATRRVEDASGGSFAVSKGAQEIFDLRDSDDNLASGNVFAALNSLRNSLLNNDQTQIAATNGALQVASDHLNVSQAFYGTVQNRIQDATNYAAGYSGQLKIQLGQKQDADIAAAALAITQGNTELQAAFSMQAKMPRTTLFDFMV